jgi:hypothetical protein
MSVAPLNFILHTSIRDAYNFTPLNTKSTLERKHHQILSNKFLG